MSKFFKKEYLRIKESKFIYPIRLFLQCIGLLLVCQWFYSAGDSVYKTGELNVVWRANWIFAIAPIVWILYLSSVILISKILPNINKHP